MSELPTGTVTLLFSDIEGSTVLLSRLGPAYADALDGQRQVLRKAWAENDGIELGTEGDSFFVVFATAEEAVTAAAQAQRELAAFEWPGGEQVRVRMGLHTGTPTIHDGGYVGMDVHRAARIAGSAHGGQVVLSETTAKLVGACLPERDGMRDLGSHQLKDLPRPERLFQLTIDGLPDDFPPVKTLGAASSLPRPATPLVGRDGELAELTALLRSPEVRLVTLTGPGGSGKTRLAVGVAERLVEAFPDGAYFVPLAAVTTEDVMWTSIAETLNVPPEGRIPPGFFEHVAHRSALFVLDNLEQVDGADTVVAELLEHGPQVVVIATSRRPLNLPGELQHAVPPLELPEQATLKEAERSGAVQLFVQHAKAVKASFTLTAANAADVAEICRRLDGLPLAIELAGARTKLLSPAALLARLDKALDLAATGSRTPSRQRTLRETIAWSYNLLNPTQQAFFRRLGVFAGGADLNAVTAVTGDVLGDADPLDLVADLVDASLVTVTEDEEGEPRVGLLETIRVYARDQLEVAGDLDTAGQSHAQHCLQLAEQLRPLLNGPEHLAVRARFETEHDNFRAALSWALQRNRLAPAASDGWQISMGMCLALHTFWAESGYNAEARRWLHQVIEGADGTPGPELAGCYANLGAFARLAGDLESAHHYGTLSVDMWRQLDDASGRAPALMLLADTEAERAQTAEARTLYEEAVTVASAAGNNTQLANAVCNYAVFEKSLGNLDHALTLLSQAIDLDRAIGDHVNVLIDEHNVACLLRRMGRPAEAQRQMRKLIPEALRINERFLVDMAEDYAAVLSELDDCRRAVRLFGAAEAMRERIGLPRDSTQQAAITDSIAITREALVTEEWRDAYNVGRGTSLEDALSEAHMAGDRSLP